MIINPFLIEIPDGELRDLEQRLRNTRWPGAIDPQTWADGSSLSFMRDLVGYWLEKFDWKAQEARLNRLSQFVAEIAGLKIHFILVKGKGPSPMPLILTHGWPGSFLEMERVIPLLTDPVAHGGNERDAFDLVVPSLPGYAFSSAPERPGISPFEIAGLWQKLMIGLGYERFGAQGGDIGAAVSSWLGFRFPGNVIGLHLNYIPGSFSAPLDEGLAQLSPAEQDFRKAAANWADKEGAYAHIQATKPQTLAYGISDSPVGLAAWLVEKFSSWSDCNGDVLSVFTMDTLLTEICLYWFSGSLDASLRLYKESKAQPLSFRKGQRITPPVAISHFAKELPQPPRSWVERVYNVVAWNEHVAGGHLAAMERPEELVADIRAHFGSLR
ncbi:pimeloyl-ACP methyl ester carboxylesterase [Rhizobium sp. BK512]|jgi:pimeloyl-ACP methyl ester carboxylesterase|uniref:epoxide hydrolase family protein n=1 Tax=Rhizobium sp. BK512 TaxID=2587010 RepID=UPI000DD5B541|nr:epoxide hydrolase family protein [Rhizobium sp. BK512]MBB3565879.1 pimeloyl-ACP methyl ester carboxylesterase [Rhizobium sp. BK512]